MSDFTLYYGDFNTTSVEVKADSEKGQAKFGEMFGDGAVSVNLPKTKGCELEQYLTGEGFTVNVWIPDPEEKAEPVLYINPFGEPVTKRLGVNSYARQPGDRF